MSRWRLYLLRAALVLVTLLIGLAVAEVAARATYGPGFLSVVDPYEHHPYRAYVELPDVYGKRMFTNSLGWKDSQPRHEIRRDPAPRRRIVCLGDSFTEGLGVPQEQTFSAHMERQLGKSFEVLNGGRVSYSPLLEYMRLKKFLDEGYEADVAVLLPDLSDVQDELAYAPEYEFSAAGEPLRLRSGSYAPAVLWLYNRSALVRWLRRAQLHWQGQGPVAETAHSNRENVLAPAQVALLQAAGPLSREAYGALPEGARAILRHNWSDHRPSVEGWAGEGLRSMEENVVRMQQLAQRHGMRLAVVIYPCPQVLYTREDPAQYELLRERFPKWFHEREQIFGTRPSGGAAVYREAMRRICQERSIPFLDLFPAFERTPQWHRLFLAGDVHFNAEGHRLVGREIVAALLREGVL